MKPQGEYYAHIERTLDMAPEGLLLIDDGEGNVAAARDRGWSAIHYTGESDLSQIDAWDRG